MASSSDHFAAVFKNNCLIRPRNPESQLPATTLEFLSDDENDESYSPKEPLQKASTMRGSDDYHDTMRTPNTKHHMDTDVDKQRDLSNLLGNNEKFYKHLQELRFENKKTLKMLEKIYKSHQKDGRRSKIDKNNFIGNMMHEQQNEKADKNVEMLYDSITNNEDTSSFDDNLSGQADHVASEHFHSWRNHEESSEQSSNEVDEDPRAAWPKKFSHNILPDETELFRGRPFSYEVIDSMWDDFSVESYAPKGNETRNDPPAKDEWVPSITIPEPFQMTLREAAKSKVKSKRKEKLEQELMKKKIEEESELNKKFKARPIPATTFMQLYKENEAKEEEKREYRRQLSKAILEATQKPFDFMKRENMKRELRRSQSLERINQTRNDTGDFKAKPFPADLFNLSLEDKRAEQEEYRRIKMKMRAQELLATSNLPPNMRARGQRYTINKRYANRQPKTALAKSQNFQPIINHEIPDFNEMQEKFEVELLRKRKEKTPTICEPFNLHTAKVSARRSNLYNSWNNETSSREGFFNTTAREAKRNTANQLRSSTPDKQRNTNGLFVDDAPPFAITETMRRRHAKTQESLKNRTKAEEDQKKKAQEKKKRENQLRRQVTKKSIANDMNHVLKKQNQDRLRSYKESELARAKEYRQYLKEMKSRVDERPLLFEQESQTNAKRAARRRYEQILKEAGVDDIIVSSLVTEDGKIVNAESDDDYDTYNENTADLILNESEDDTTLLAGKSADDDDVPDVSKKETTADVSDVSVEDVSDVE